MSPAGPPSARIVADIRRRIAAGELRPGDRVPSTRQITREWGVAIATATRVLAALRQEGLVRVVPGVGTVVDGREPAPQPARRREHREPERELTREQVVRAAIAVADSEGLAALSMRRVAADLGLPTMSLYRYVPGKDELVLLMVDAVMAEERPPAAPPPGWRAQLELLARTQWRLYRRHPWAPHVISMTRPQLLPNGVDHTEWALRVLHGMGLEPNETLHAAVTLAGYVRGTALNLELEAQAREETGVTDEEWMEAQHPAMAELLATGRYPTFAALVQTGELDLDLDSLFEHGLQQLMDGLDRRIQRRGRD